MKRILSAWAVAVAASIAVVSAQGTPPVQQPPTQPPVQTAQAAQGVNTQQKTPPDVTVTGCVVLGSEAGTFLLQNAKMKVDDKNEVAKTFLLVNQVEDISLKDHVTHEVTVTGQAETKTPPVAPPGQKVKDADLPKFTATALVVVADRCTTSPR